MLIVTYVSISMPKLNYCWKKGDIFINYRSVLLPNTVLSSLELLLLLPWGLCRTEAAEATVAWGCWGCCPPLLPAQPLLPKLPELTSELLQPDGELLLGTDELQSPELILCPSEVISRLLQPPSRLSEILEIGEVRGVYLSTLRLVNFLTRRIQIK